MTTDDLRGQRILVTGASGFIGGHLVRALSSDGAEVHALRRPGSRVPALALPDIAWHLADLCDQTQTERAVGEADPDVTFHLASYGANRRERDPETLHRVNVGGTWSLWRALRRTRSRLVMTGTSAEYGPVRGPAVETMACRPLSMYAACKHAAVTLVTSLSRESRRHTVVVRPYGPFGPGDDPTHVLPYVLEGLMNGDRVTLTGAEQVRSFMYVDDLIAALIRAGAATTLPCGAIYNVGVDHGVTIRELASRIHAVADGAGAIEFGALPYDENELFEVVPDIGAARRDLGFVPTVSLDEGIRRTAEWMRRARGSIA